MAKRRETPQLPWLVNKCYIFKSVTTVYFLFQMESCSVTLRNGQTTRLENVFIRGSKIRFLVLPDMLKNAPMFANMTAGNRGRGSAGSGKSAILRAQVNLLLGHIVSLFGCTRSWPRSWWRPRLGPRWPHEEVVSPAARIYATGSQGLSMHRMPQT
ncbi:hypothetical protein HAZT_HAZT001060 [Hyalella azteca]|uniref:LSM domain-containing protein n=1 Tax=Hyalella azteca TaxID=294128 RepID=A0A6A0H3W2_HYAAZ|nr:hypothetical protein HAZT_HAZT001060 [Hyalella azteca]